MKARYAVAMAGLILGLMSGTASASTYTFTFSQTNTGVLETGAGSIDLSGLNYLGTTNGGPLVFPQLPAASVGAAGSVDIYSASFDSSQAFGTGGPTLPDSGLGPTVGFAAGSDSNGIAVPEGYESGELTGSTAVFGGQTFASLGLTPGTYTYTYSPDIVSEIAVADFTPVSNTFVVQVGTVPLPASAPMFGAALVALGAVGYGMKRKKAAAAA